MDPTRNFFKLLREGSINVKNLHDDESFIKEVGKFSQEVAASLAAVTEFASHGRFGDNNGPFPGVLDALDKIGDGISVLKDQLKTYEQAMQKQNAAAPVESSGPKTTFKKA